MKKKRMKTTTITTYLQRSLERRGVIGRHRVEVGVESLAPLFRRLQLVVLLEEVFKQRHQDLVERQGKVSYIRGKEEGTLVTSAKVSYIRGRKKRKLIISGEGKSGS